MEDIRGVRLRKFNLRKIILGVRMHFHHNRKSDIDKLEKVQKRARKIIQGMGNFKYPERLRQLELPTFAYRRNRGDMIVTYKLAAIWIIR